LLQGAGGEQEWRLLLRYLETQTVLSPERPWPTHVAAARIFYDCRRKGLAVRSVVDCLIAQIALDADADLLHDDDDFDAIKQVRPLRAGRGGGDGRGSTAQRYGRGQSGRSSHSPKGRSVRSQ
jgi:predicted nucleic acid-binding protein